jgi:signal peptide peptidase SppA
MSFSDLIKKLPFLKPSNPVVAILPLEGVIGSSSKFSSAINLAGVEKNIEAAFDVSGVKAVAITINSPGGSPVQSELIMRKIREISKEKEIPVYTFAEDVAASGGYFLMLAGDELYASRASIVGSIGVINMGFGYKGAMEKLGIERRVYAAGDSKSQLDPFQDEKPADVKRMKELLKEIHVFFKDIVNERREGKLKATEKDLFNGKIWCGDAAVEVGLIDGIGDIRTVMKEKLGAKVKFKRIEEEKGFFKSLLGMKISKMSMVDDVVKMISSKSEWGRFGL